MTRVAEPADDPDARPERTRLHHLDRLDLVEVDRPGRRRTGRCPRRRRSWGSRGGAGSGCPGPRGPGLRGRPPCRRSEDSRPWSSSSMRRCSFSSDDGVGRHRPGASAARRLRRRPGRRPGSRRRAPMASKRARPSASRWTGRVAPEAIDHRRDLGGRVDGDQLVRAWESELKTTTGWSPPTVSTASTSAAERRRRSAVRPRPGCGRDRGRCPRRPSGSPNPG